MLDLEMRRIVPKAAGTYFIVRDKSQVTEIENENKMRLFFINTEKGPTNMAVMFAKGDKTGFKNMFGTATRAMRKKGNFSIDTCLDAIEAGPITVVNLRPYDDRDTGSVVSMNPSVNKITKVQAKIPYLSLVNRTSFWTPNYNAISNHVDGLLNFANIGMHNISIFVTKSKNADTLTADYKETLMGVSFDIDDYPALDENMLFADTCVDVYLFNNKFGVETTGNKYYGHLFDNSGNVNNERLTELAQIPESGFVKMFTGTVIPNVVSERGVEISINNVINQYFMETGLICDINEDKFESEEKDLLNFYVDSLYDPTGNKTSASEQQNFDNILSHVLPVRISVKSGEKVFPDNTNVEELNSLASSAHRYVYNVQKTAELNSFVTTFEYGIRYGDTLVGTTRNVKVTGIEIIEADINKGSDYPGFNKVKVTCDGPVKFDDNKVTKIVDVLATTMLKSFVLEAGIANRPEQFLDGTPARQSEILDMMNDPGIVKGVAGLKGIRYIVDCFKSYVEAGYKHQYGLLAQTLDERNRFVRTIINEPFIEDLQKSTNPLFRQSYDGSFDLSYLTEGGNKNYSSKLLNKFTTGAEYCFFYGPGEVVNNVVMPLAGKISNLFYNKANAFDVVANQTGVLSNVSSLEYAFDDTERMYLEHFNYNPVITVGGNVVIFGNLTGQQKKTAQQQITNSELLAYIKETLYAQGKYEAFTKGNYDDYLRTEVEAKNFFMSLSLAGAIDPDYTVVCNASNNTEELRKQKIKLVSISYTPVDCLEKVVFDLTIN